MTYLEQIYAHFTAKNEEWYINKFLESLGNLQGAYYRWATHPTKNHRLEVVGKFVALCIVAKQICKAFKIDTYFMFHPTKYGFEEHFAELIANLSSFSCESINDIHTWKKLEIASVEHLAEILADIQKLLTTENILTQLDFIHSAKKQIQKDLISIGTFNN